MAEIEFDFASRIESARKLMADQQVEAMLLSLGSDLPYLSGYQAMPLERLTMLVVPLSGDPVLVVPQLEAPRVKPGPFDLRPFGETEEPTAIVADLCRGLNSLAIGDETWSVFLLRLQNRLPAAAFSSATPITRILRSVKDPLEVERLREAGAGLDRVTKRLSSYRFSGRTEREVSHQVSEWTLEEGHDAALFSIVASGPNAASPHHEPTDRKIQPGDLVVVDFGGKHAGYSSDCTRTFSVGEPDADKAEVHAVVHEAQQSATSAVRPGIEAQEVDEVARAVIAAAGYGEYFIHRVGHGIGLDAHEHPYLVSGNEEILEPGMCFSIEPGIYLPGRFGVRIEDIVTVTPTGVEVLNNSPRDLVVVE